MIRPFSQLVVLTKRFHCPRNGAEASSTTAREEVNSVIAKIEFACSEAISDVGFDSNRLKAKQALRGDLDAAADTRSAQRSEKHRAIRESNRHDEILTRPTAMGKTCRSIVAPRQAAGVGGTGGAASSSARKPQFLCAPSQKGLFDEWPQRQSAITGLLAGIVKGLP